MGIKKEDVTSITVANVDCVHLEERYSVSTRSADPSANSANSAKGAKHAKHCVFSALPQRGV